MKITQIAGKLAAARKIALNFAAKAILAAFETVLVRKTALRAVSTVTTRLAMNCLF